MRKSIFILACAMLSSGCERTLRGTPDTQYSAGSRANLEAIVFDERLSDRNVRLALATPSTASRNSIVLARMAEIDSLYNDYESAILTEARGTNFVLSVGSLAAGLLGGFTTGGASQIYSLVGGGIAAVQTSYNKEVLAEATVQAFISQMRANRARVRAEIFGNLQADHAKYSIEAALSDLQSYRQAGTLAAGIVGLSEQAQLADQRESVVARDNSRDFFTRTLPDDVKQQEIILRLVNFIKGDAGLDRYIAEAARFGIVITATDRVGRRTQALAAMPEAPEAVNRAIAVNLDLL